MPVSCATVWAKRCPRLNAFVLVRFQSNKTEECVFQNNSGKQAIQAQTHHPASVQRISELEAPKGRREEAQDGPKQVPQFIQQLTEPAPVKEGENVHLECQLLPVDDPDLRVSKLS